MVNYKTKGKASSNWHVNSKGIAGQCSATQKCPFGGVSGQENHFYNKEDAIAFGQKKLKEEHGAFGTLKKESRGLSLEESFTLSEDQRTSLSKLYLVEQNNTDQRVLESLSKHKNLDSRLMKKLLKKDLNQETLANLVLGNKDQVLISNAFNKLEKTDNPEQYYKNFARNNNTPPEILEKITESTNKYNHELASNRNITDKLAKSIISDNADQYSWIKRSRLASNKNISDKIKELLSNDESYHVKVDLIRNNNIDKSLSLKLADDKNSDVIATLGKNTSDEKIQDLVYKRYKNDRLLNKSDIAVGLLKNPKLSEKLQKRFSKGTILEKNILASNPYVSKEILDEFTKSKDYQIRENAKRSLKEGYNIYF